MNPHVYEGNMAVCVKPGCYQVASHSVHVLNATALSPMSAMEMMQAMRINKIEAVAPLPRAQAPACPHCQHLQSFHGKDGCGFEVGMCACDHNELGVKIVRKELHQDLPRPIALDPAAPINCPGHTCPTCSCVWLHDYTCGGGKGTVGLCHNCAQQTAANINRAGNVEQIKVLENAILTGAEIVNIMNEHESFVVLNLCKDQSGADLPSDVWQANIAAHRLDLRKKIEALRAREMATSRVMAKRQTEDMLKLSPEEREAYEKSAKRNAKPKTAPVLGATAGKTKADKKEAQGAYQKMLEGLCSEISKGKPEMSAQDAKKEAFIQSMLPALLLTLRKEKPGKTDEDYARIARKRAEILASED